MPLHLQKVHSHLNYPLGSLPNSEQLSTEVLSLPMFPELSLFEQQIIVEAISQASADLYCLFKYA